MKAPEYIQDAAAAVAWTFKHIEQFGGSRQRIFVAGHSAGGYLTSMIGLDKRWLAAHQIDANALAGLISLSGQAITHFTVRAERGIEDKRPVIDDLAPLYHVRPDAPPLLLVSGDREKELLGCRRRCHATSCRGLRKLEDQMWRVLPSMMVEKLLARTDCR